MNKYEKMCYFIAFLKGLADLTYFTIKLLAYASAILLCQKYCF